MFGTTMFACSEKSDSEVIGTKKLEYPKELIDQFSYSLGHEFGQRLRHDSVKLNMDYYLKGYKDGLDSIFAFVPADSMDVYKAKFAEIMMAKMDAMAAKEAEKKQMDEEQIMKELEKIKKTAKEDGDKYLTTHKNETGVKVTSSGLQYKILQEGSGRIAKDDDVVKLHMSIKALNAPDFQDTRVSEPMIVPIKELFPGWKEGMKLMKKGSKFEFTIPSSLAFGEKGFGPAFPPNVVVVLNVDLLDFSTETELTQFREKMMQIQQQKMQEMQQKQQMQQKK